MPGKTHIITGGAGFVGINLASELLNRGDKVVLIDNLSRGREKFVFSLPQERVTFLKVDVADHSALDSALRGVPVEADVEVWHLAANSDIPAGVSDPDVDYRDTFLVTHQLLNCMRTRGWKRLYFSSTSAVYGDHGTRELTETTWCQPISNYGAMKLASEAAISASAESFLDRACVFRFPNVVGVPATHGVILDFINKLQRTPDCLNVLGNGAQRKAYLHVSELVSALLWIYDNGPAGQTVFNIGPTDDGITVREIAELVCATVSPSARLSFGTEDRGWVGDVPRFTYNVDKLSQAGWSPALTSRDAILRAVTEIHLQEQKQADKV